MLNNSIQIRGARTHNLQDIDLDIPRNQLVVLTGLSGSGKSSLAFDTLLAEGQRQYLESLSLSARQFFDQMERPDVDLIAGLQPTIALDQKPIRQSPRSTVATVTEIYDFLRLLMARTAQVHCPDCGTPIAQQTAAEIKESIRQLPEGTRVMILAPMVRGRLGKHAEVMEKIRQEGFVRVRLNGEMYEIEQAPELSARKRHHIEAVVDRIIIRTGQPGRLGESIALALKHGEGTLKTCYLTPPSGVKGQMKTQGETEHWSEQVFSTLYACPDCKHSLAEVEPRTFSFNSPYGACQVCDGLGEQESFAAELVLPDLSLSLSQGAIAPWREHAAAAREKDRLWLASLLTQSEASWETPLNQWPLALREQLLAGDGDRFPGLIAHLEMDYAKKRKTSIRENLASYREVTPCPACEGSRLQPVARACQLGGLSVYEITALSLEQAYQFFSTLKFDSRWEPIGRPCVDEIVRRLAFLIHVGVGYLSLDRPANSLSGGEMQRVRLATGIGSGLVGVLYILDEPSIGLHPHDNGRLIESLRQLQQQGNSVLVVEHDEAMMRASDWLVELGPGAGERGGTLVAQGVPEEIIAAPTSLTGRYLSGQLEIEKPARRRQPNRSRMLLLEGAVHNNLAEVTFELPLGLFTCVTGVSGSGKSSLVIDTLARALGRQLQGSVARPGPFRELYGVAQLDRLIHVDQSPLGRSSRSNPATYTGVYDEIRKIFASTKRAKQAGYKLGRFSFNAPGGRCENCQGRGVEQIEMRFLADLFVTCPVCQGRQFNRQTLAVRYRDHSIADVLAMSIDKAATFFENHANIQLMLSSLVEIGLGYLKLGQRSSTLSGGEAQRIRLAAELGRPTQGHVLYILDEPTTGLHTDDIRRLLAVLQKLVSLGNSMLVIEHNLEVIKTVDWVIDMGPAGGTGGGQIVVAGTPEEVAACSASLTGRYLAEIL